MPTISQLPSADSVAASDLIPISQGGSVHSISVGALLAQTQPAIIVGPPSLLGRFSMGPGGPDTIALGEGLALNNGTLSFSSFNLSALPIQTSLSSADLIVVTGSGTSQLVGLDQIREIFTAGSNITIDSNGVISTSAEGGGAAYSLAGLSSTTALAAGDSVGVSQGGQDHTITYANFLDGLTIDLASAATPASDSDTFWAAQTSNVMVRQTLSALWPWISAKLPLWKRSVIELRADTTLSPSVHNNAILVCSSSVLISASPVSLGSGFSCELINACSGPVTLSGTILTSNGLSQVSSYQCCTIQCVSYSGGTTVFASISSGSAATMAPGQVSGLATTSLSSTSITVSWFAPTTGGAASAYSTQYRVTGTVTWLPGGQTNGVQSFTIGGLQAATAYDISVVASNNVGSGPTSTILAALTPASSPVPGAPTAVTAANVTQNSLTCSWIPPGVGGTGMVYAVKYRVSGQTTWNSASSNLTATSFNLSNLLPSTSYDLQITASNSGGSGPPSAIVTVQTASPLGSVTSIVWNLVPTGSFAHGTGAIGMNAQVTPATASVQFGFSTSSNVAPTTWVVALNVNSNLWGQYVPTPASAGSWYAWVEGTDGSSPTVYGTPFTVT